ncbi:hypothetical protein [Bradyrhizobium valentinum]|uniref:hypothetical protein n=1 Tax=Bradyrhizobium valentinum TaxID=1518501 RepID=UPI000AF1D4BF|nr:hypothetical protein [Bradyrhizobium valentinum]
MKYALKLSRRAALGAVAVAPFCSSARAVDFQVVEVQPGQNVDVFFQINLSGKVYTRIETRNGPGCANFWWILWPFGNIRELGKQCGFADFEIPGLFDFSVSSKLRAGGVSELTKVGFAADAQVARSITIEW